MVVTFRKLAEQRCVTWDAVRGKRIRIPGPTMALGRGLPHDLMQIVAEGVLGIDRGFWGSVAAGATFKSMGRKITKPGRAVIVANRQCLDEAEHVVNGHFARWVAGKPTPVAAQFEAFKTRWEALPDQGELVIEWPSLRVMQG